MKEIEFFGSALKTIRKFPIAAKQEAGYQLDRISTWFRSS